MILLLIYVVFNYVIHVLHDDYLHVNLHVRDRRLFYSRFNCFRHLVRLDVVSRRFVYTRFLPFLIQMNTLYKKRFDLVKCGAGIFWWRRCMHAYTRRLVRMAGYLGLLGVDYLE